jgi:hypothetical protein
LSAWLRHQRERAYWVGRRLLLRVLGRELRCAECGRPLFHGIALVWHGRVRLIGAYGHTVRVSFASDDTLELRHVELHECPAPGRPWAG